MSRIVTIEAVTDGVGYICRCRGDGGNGSTVFEGDKSLKKALEHARLYFLAPYEGVESSSFPFAALETTTDSIAVEPKSKESDRLEPTKATYKKLDKNAQTEIIKPKWARPSKNV